MMSVCKKTLYFFIFLGILNSPVHSADIVINEIMWSGTTASRADEWIELRNMTSSSISLSNWSITKIANKVEELMLTIPSGKSISAGSYFLIANYSEDSEKSKLNVTPEVVNTSVSLFNSYLQIKLYNGTWNDGGTLVDTANDGDAPLAGDNSNKYSMERNPSPEDGTLSSSWHTATSSLGFDSGATERGTPGSANSLPSNDPPEIVSVERNPLYPGSEDKVKVSCEVCDSNLDSVTLMYSTGEDYVSVNMSLESEKYKGEIPAYGEGVKVNYYVEAEDRGGQTSISSTYFYTVGVNPRIVINEFLADPASDWNNDNEINSKDEWIEIYNKESTPVDISNWVLDDIENGGTKPYTNTIGTTIEAGGFLVFYKSETKIALNNGGDTVRLLDNGGNLVDSYSYTTSSDDVSQGRVPDGENVWTSLDAPSPGNPNPETVSTSSSGDVIINEIMYDPVSNDYDCEWIELYNKEDKPVNLKGWELDGKEIPQTTIGAYSYLVITDDLLDRDNDGYSFEQDWGDGSGVWGDWAGENFTVMEVSISFSNKGDTVILNDGTKDINVLTYDSSWGGGKGVSLERINFNLPNLKTNWGSSIIPNGATSGKLNSLAEKSIYKPILLINEINFRVSPNWVEIYCKDDDNNGEGVNLAGYYLTDLDVADKIIGNTTIKTGEYLLLHYGVDYVDETSSSEGNKNGIIDIWTDVSGITATNEQMVLYNAVYTIVDAVCWSEGTLSDSEKRDLEEIYEAGEWDGKMADDCIDSQEVGTKKTIARQNFEDTNSQNNWIVSFPTPGWDNSDLEKANQAVKITSFRILPKVFFPHGDGNPPNTTISYILSKEAEVTIRIYDVKGRLINTLVDQKLLLSGVNETVWDGKDEDGDIVSLGIYICYLEAVCSQGNDTAKKTVVAAKKLN